MLSTVAPASKAVSQTFARNAGSLRVGAPGQPPLRYASALKLPAVLYDGPEPCPVYAGTLCAAAGVRAP